MKKSIFVILSCLIAFGAEAETELTADAAVESAMAHNISIERSQLTLQGLKRAKNNSWNSMLPSVQATTGISRPNNPSAYDFSVSAGVDLGLSFSPAVFTAINTASLQYEAGEISFLEACRSVELAVRTGFYSLLYEQAYIAQQERMLETARQQYEQNRRQYEAGRISELDVLSAQVNYEKLKPTLETARTTYMNDLDSFKLLIGMDVSEDVRLEGSLDPLLTLSEVSLDGVDINPTSIQYLEKSLEAAKAGLASARANAYSPVIALKWGYQPGAANTDWTRWEDTSELTLSLSLPLDNYLPWSQVGDLISQAKETVSDTALQLEDKRLQTYNLITAYLRQISQARVSIASSQANVELARKSYELAQESYNRGARDLLSLQSASDALFEAEVALLQQAYNLGVAILNLENETGVPFGTLSAQAAGSN